MNDTQFFNLAQQTEAARCTLFFLEGRSDREEKPMQILKETAVLTLKKAEQEGTKESVKLRTSELMDWLRTQGVAEESSGRSDNRWLSRYWSDLQKILETSQEDLEEKAREKGFAWMPAPEKSPGRGRGNESIYLLGVVPTPPAAEVEQPNLIEEKTQGEETKTPPNVEGIRGWPDLPSNPGQVLYRAERRSLSWFNRFFFHVDVPLTRNRKAVIVVIAFPLFLLLVLLLLSPFIAGPFTGAMASLSSALQLLFFGGAILYFLFWPVFGPVFLRVIPMPTLLAPFASTEAMVLEMVNHRKKDPNHPGEIQAVKYAAICPICGNILEVSGGGLRFWGRLVGRCEESPREHVFSFDHVTRTGYPLTAAGYRPRSAGTAIGQRVESHTQVEERP